MPTFLSANGVQILKANVAVPRIGVWRADLTIDTSNLAGFGVGQPVVIRTPEAELLYSGTVRRSGMNRGSVSIRMVGGAGGLASPARARSYKGVTAGIILADILKDAGERLSPHASKTILRTQIQRHSRVAQTAAEQIMQLTTRLDVPWRILADGSFWLGVESWQQADLEYVLIDNSPAQGHVHIASDTPTVYPGQTLEGERVSYVEHYFSPGGIRSRVWMDSA